jgi:UDPglucose--hexose-1-phosphate uridylyltransferase
MSELRHDALTGRLVLLAPGRADRPSTTPTAGPSPSPASCPFCPGHEHETPPEVFRLGAGAPDTPGWRVRVVPNLYPIVSDEGGGAGAHGAHEVIVVSPDHAATFGALDDEAAVEAMTIMQERSRAHAASGRDHVQVFVNQGRAAGASIEHPHAQVIALEFVPPSVSVAVERFEDAKLDLVLGDQSDAIGDGGGVVVGDAVRAWCPRASASPFEVRVAALGAGPRFARATDGETLGVALVLRDVLDKVRRLLDDPPYNVVVHDAPVAGDVTFHWWVEIVPRIAVVAGFELGTGVLVNTVDPANAAQLLRDA